jgi:hypothetical protein
MVRGLMMGLGAIAAVTVLATTPAWAQERGIRVYADVGGLSALRDLNQAGTADFRTGFDMEGGVGWQRSETFPCVATSPGDSNNFVMAGSPRER